MHRYVILFTLLVVQRLLPVSAHGEFLSHRKKVVGCLVVRSQDFRDK